MKKVPVTGAGGFIGHHLTKFLVKRGYWVVSKVLGERIPSPPPTVPELPKDEAKLGELTLPQVLARHRADKACAASFMRARITPSDSIGATASSIRASFRGRMASTA